MAFAESFENLKDSAAGAVQTAAKKTKMLALIAKYKVQIASEQEKIRKAYQELGRIYYKDFATDEEPDEAEYQPWCDKISTSFRRINQLKREIEEAKAEAAANGEVIDDVEVPDEEEAPEVIFADDAPEKDEAPQTPDTAEQPE